MKIRAVIVGCAHMHVNEIALYLSQQPDSELCGIATTPSDLPPAGGKRYTAEWNLANIASQYNTPVYESWQEMLDTLHPDVAYLLCENSKKADMAEEIARRGIDLIIEKPMATTAREAERIVALKAKYGVNIFVNWPVAWRGYLLKMKQALDSGMCGELRKLRYLNGHTGPLGKGARHRGVSATAEEMTDEERGNTWWYHSQYGGGAYLDILCYGCYFSRWLFGKLPEDVMSVAENLNTSFGDVEDNLAAILRYKEGFAVAEGTWTTPRKRMPTGPELVCTDGVIWCGGVPDGEATVEAIDIYGNELCLEDVPADLRFRNMPWHYAAFKNEGKPIYETLTVEFNADVVRMIEAAMRSNQSRRAEVPVK